MKTKIILSSIIILLITCWIFREIIVEREKTILIKQTEIIYLRQKIQINNLYTGVTVR